MKELDSEKKGTGHGKRLPFPSSPFLSLGKEAEKAGRDKKKILVRAKGGVSSQGNGGRT